MCVFFLAGGRFEWSASFIAGKHASIPKAIKNSMIRIYNIYIYIYIAAVLSNLGLLALQGYRLAAPDICIDGGHGIHIPRWTPKRTRMPPCPHSTFGSDHNVPPTKCLSGRKCKDHLYISIKTKRSLLFTTSVVASMSPSAIRFQGGHM